MSKSTYCSMTVRAFILLYVNFLSRVVEKKRLLTEVNKMKCGIVINNKGLRASW